MGSSDDDDADARKDKRSKALGWAWLQPDRAAEIARQGGMEFQALADYLSTSEGAAEAEAAALALRRSGDFISERSKELVELLLDHIEKQVRSEGVSVNAAAKLLDSTFKVTGIAAARDIKARESALVDAPKFSMTFNLGSQDKSKPRGMIFETIKNPAPVSRLLDSINKPFADDADAEDSAAQMDDDHAGEG